MSKVTEAIAAKLGDNIIENFADIYLMEEALEQIERKGRGMARTQRVTEVAVKGDGSPRAIAELARDVEPLRRPPR